MKLQLLKTDADFAHARFKKFSSTSSLRIRTALRNQNSPRFGFIVPKKILPKVTDRNKVKRRLKNILTKQQSFIKPVDIIFFPQKSSLKLTFARLEAEV